jgi:hypothetical protein
VLTSDSNLCLLIFGTVLSVDSYNRFLSLFLHINQDSEFLLLLTYIRSSAANIVCRMLTYLEPKLFLLIIFYNLYFLIINY